MDGAKLIHISGCVPFSASWYSGLKIKNCSLDEIVMSSRRYEQPYLAWELVRRNKNPFFNQGTGFEGYFVGLCQSTDEVVARLIPVGREILENIARRYRMEYGFKARLMKTLYGQLSDTRAIAAWASILGATVARLRCNLHHNLAADIFRIDTYRLTKSLPDIHYCEEQGLIHQEYTLGYQRPNRHPAFDIQQLKPCEQEAALVTWTIGRFGHPFLRSYIRYACQ